MNATWTDILWYLAIGIFFMMIRRGGCCGGHSHKKQSQESRPNDHDMPQRRTSFTEAGSPGQKVRTTSPRPRRTP